MTFVGVIPARGGSKGIPKKNLALCDGKPLLAYAAEAALGCKRLQRTILSTDDEEIAAVGRKLGLQVPFLRPAKLARDDTPMLEVLRHLLKWFEDNATKPDAVVLLQPTSPLRGAQHIAGAVDLFEQSNAATVVSVLPVPHQFTPGSLMEMQDGRLTPWLKDQPPVLRRQDKAQLYARNGPAILIARADVIRDARLYGDPTVGYVMSANDSIDVDGPDELTLAEAVLKARRESAGCK
jgi:CMP-N-acetylneuraminic acid synthetase